jgi:hypothetical protein
MIGEQIGQRRASNRAVVLAQPVLITAAASRRLMHSNSSMHNGQA